MEVKKHERYFTIWEMIRICIKNIYPHIRWTTYGENGKWYFQINKAWLNKILYSTKFEIKNPYQDIPKPIKDKNGIMRCSDCGQELSKKDLEKIEDMKKMNRLNHR
ncbi:MAG: hypothetical protein PHP92_03495 [Candidatus Nanoarchaeia archaeon]|nr:hypothetical protein [Candidatus Nanoarchaeia archaeon]